MRKKLLEAAAASQPAAANVDDNTEGLEDMLDDLIWLTANSLIQT